MKEEYREENTTSSRIEGRHSVLEALRAGSLIERLFVQKGCQDGPVLTILREAKKADVMVDFVPKERLDFMSETKNHQGVVAVLSALGALSAGFAFSSAGWALSLTQANPAPSCPRLCCFSINRYNLFRPYKYVPYFF